MDEPLNFCDTLGYVSATDQELLDRSAKFQQRCSTRRSLRSFSSRQVPDDVIRNCILAAGSAPSGANQQPWHFSVVSAVETKHRIRVAAEAEEREFYERRAPESWLAALRPLGTDSQKPFLEIASHLIVVFTQTHSLSSDGQTQKHYYSTESVGIATGILITALHHSGLVTLTHTPSPMAFLNTILGRPKTERPFLLLVVGFPSTEATVPNIHRKSIQQISSWH